MRILFAVTPARLLPAGVLVNIVEGDRDVILQLSDATPLEDLAEALTSAVNEYAVEAWQYIGGPDHPPARLRAVD